MASAPVAVADALRLDLLRYGQVWEDHRLLEAGLRVGPDDHLLSITSGGCNVLNLLLQEPRRITAVDMNPAQSALLELQLGAMRTLDHAGFVALLGHGEGDREALYRQVRPALPASAQAHWDRHAAVLREGPAHAGRLDAYIRAFREEQLPPVVDRAEVAALFRHEDAPAQEAAFRDLVARPGVEAAYRAHFGRATMAAKGRHESQFRYVRIADLGAHNWRRFQALADRGQVHRNPYLERFLTGRHHDLEHAPPYLRPASFPSLKALADRVEVVTGSVEAAAAALPRASLAGANLSNMFEYLSSWATGRVLAHLAKALRPGGRLAYWNLYVPRARPAWLATRLRPRRAEASALHARDRMWWYADFHLEERAP